MKIYKFLLTLSIFSIALFAKESDYKVKQQVSIQSTDNPRPVLIEDSGYYVPQSREEIDLFVEDFENNANGWTYGPGWQLTTDDANSPTHSMLSPDDNTTLNATHDLLSPVLSLPALGEEEFMHFSFYLKGDMPDTDGDGDNYLEDYYSVSLMDVDALAWHASSTDSYDGNSYWCADESIGQNGGYLDSWIQFMDTPQFTVPGGGSLSVDLMWTIEDPAGAVVAGSCTDGWDAANVQISTDGGQNWNLLSSLNDPYDFDCGYGWIWNSTEYDTGGSLNHLAAGWGGNADWHNVTFNLAQYAGQQAIVRFAFGSDPAYSTLDDGSITGFHVDNIVVSSNALSCDPESECPVTAAGAVWVDQFYDYCDTDRPGYQAWEEYLLGMPFNGNVFLDISDFAEKDVTFRIQSRYDENTDGGQGAGLFIDDFRVYKVSGGSYPAPTDLMGEGLNESASLTWSDMNASGTDDFIYDNDAFSNGITVTGGSAWAGERIDLAGNSTINSISVFNNNLADTTLTIAAFGQFGSLFGNEPAYTTTVNAVAGQWTEVAVSWDMSNSFIVAHEFNGSFSAAIDESNPMGHSMVMLNAGWDNWSDIATANSLSDGEWGIRANVSYDGAGVTYNVYVDGVLDQSSIQDNSATVTGLTNNVVYNFAVSATYSDGEESAQSGSIEITPQAQTVHEESHDDGSQEDWFNAGSGNFTAVRYSAIPQGEDIVRFKWYQDGDGGAFYLKLYEDDNGMPGAETYSRVIAGGLVGGWNTYDLSTEGQVASTDFWVGTKEFSSTKAVGLDTDSTSGDSYTRVGATGQWTAVDGNLMIRVYLDCGNNCPDECTDADNDDVCDDVDDCVGEYDSCGVCNGDDDCSCTAGDVNSDSVINVLDIVTTVNIVLGQTTPTDDQACAADFNGDGTINVLDIVSLVNVVLGGGA